MPNVDFITIRYKTNRVLKYFCSHFSLGWLSYGLFKGWEKKVYRYIKKSALLEKIDLIHFVAPVGYREPGYLWKLNKPYVWGPFGGMYRIPQEFLDSYPLKANILGRVKNGLNFFQFHSFRIKKVFNKSNVLIACTKTQSGMVNKLLNNGCCRYLPENGIDLKKQQAISDEFLIEKFNSPSINIIWIGCNDNRKNAKLLIKALQRCKSKNFSCTFVGSYCSDLNKLVYGNNELKQRLSFIENIPREAVLDMYKNAHLMVITSSMEANTTVLFEAMENCVPVITVDHCGMADVVKNDETGVKIKVQNQEKMVTDFASGIDELCKNPAKLLTFARNIKTTSYEYSHKYRMDFFDKCYEEAIENFEEGGGMKKAFLLMIMCSSRINQNHFFSYFRNKPVFISEASLSTIGKFMFQRLWCSEILILPDFPSLMLFKSRSLFTGLLKRYAVSSCSSVLLSLTVIFNVFPENIFFKPFKKSIFSSSFLSVNVLCIITSVLFYKYTGNFQNFLYKNNLSKGAVYA